MVSAGENVVCHIENILRKLIPISLRNVVRPYWHRLVDRLEHLKGRQDPSNKALLQGIASGFDQQSESYDDKMSYFNYAAPRLLFDALQEFLNGTPKRHTVLDAGCGTGLCGILFRPLAHQLDGVDVSPGMVEKAGQRGLYDHLETIDLIGYLNKSPSTYDLVISAGVLQFFSDLKPLFAGVNKVLRDNGYFAFTIDKIDAGDQKYVVSSRSSAMYVHHPNYIREAATATSFRIVKSDEIIERNDMLRNKAVPGVLYVFQKRIGQS